MIKELVLIKLIKEALRQRITKARIIYLQQFMLNGKSGPLPLPCGSPATYTTYYTLQV